MSDLFDEAALACIEHQIDEWLAQLLADNPVILAVDRSLEGDIRWYVRMQGEEKEFTTVWLTLGQRTLRYETYVMPAPEENAEILYESLLRRNEKLVGAHFSIGVENAIFLRGELLIGSLNSAEVDRAIGTLYSIVEQYFKGFLNIGFASRFDSRFTH